MAKCNTCDEWIFDGLNHRCERWFKVYIKDQYARNRKAECVELAASDHQDAAEKWAALVDRERLYCDRSSYEDVTVVALSDQSSIHFRVRGEVVPTYYARPLEDQK